MTLVALALQGCDPGDTSGSLSAATPIKVDNPKFAAEAGIAAELDMTPSNTVMEIAKTKYFGVRGDAFALLPSEMQFDRQQYSARLVSDSGGFSSYYSEPEEVEAAGPVIEPLPAWRLSGVVIGDGVAALLEMGPGKTIDIRPGMKIPDTDWTVVSIDTERAVLKRSGNKLPKSFAVNLQGPMSIGGGSGGGTGGSGGGNNAPTKKGPLGAAG